MSGFQQALEALRSLDRRIEHLQHIGDMPGSKLWYKLDYLWCLVRYQAAPNDYIFFRMYKKNHVERKTFVTFGKHVKINKKLNDYHQNVELIGNKAFFNEYFKEYIKRAWLYSEHATVDDLLAFLDTYKVVFYKPVCETKGRGICKLDAQNENDRAFLKSSHKKPFLLEECISQHEALSAINPFAVNSIRITTLLSKDRKTVRVLNASLKVSCNEGFVDNLSSGGLVFPIDLETGIITRPGLSYADDDYHFVHPVSKAVIVGVTIPNFADVLAHIEAMALKLPQFRYIGWDIAITTTGFDVIEANTSPGSRLLQVDGQGRYLIIKEML